VRDGAVWKSTTPPLSALQISVWWRNFPTKYVATTLVLKCYGNDKKQHKIKCLFRFRDSVFGIFCGGDSEVLRGNFRISQRKHALNDQSLLKTIIYVLLHSVVGLLSEIKLSKRLKLYFS